MRKTKITLLNILIFFGLFFVLSTTVHAEVIRDFDSTINVLPDSSILVNEKITYDFEDSIRHGIFRNITLLNSKGESMEIKVVSVTNELEEPYQFTTDISGGIINIKIGDPEKMISGIKEYDITYQVFGSITYYDNFDELYWNVTGNEWEVIIEKVEAKVILPNNIFLTQQACYYGESGSKNNCKITESGVFTTEKVLDEGEGLTVAVGFPKGAVSLYERKVDSNFVKFTKTFWPIVIPIAVFIFMFLRWYKKGRDPKGTGVIIPQYDVPDNLTPLEVGGILNGKFKSQHISAEIIYLATKGYLKIKQIDCDKDNFLCLNSEKDYEFTLLKEEGLLPNDFDKKVMTALFTEEGKEGGVVKLSGLENSFYRSLRKIDEMLVDNLLNKNYYTNLPKFLRNWEESVLSAFFIFFSFSAFFSIGNWKNFLVIVSSGIVSAVILFVFYNLMPAKSKKGVLTKEYLLGLKEYLQIAEKDRLIFHNAPDKKPEVFEHLLPYAMVLGVEELWAKEFKDIYINPPNWYEGGDKGFNAVSFGHEMAVFSSMASTSISSSPSSSSGGGSSGSSGGGSSGGGGGGGGGGSW